ncbi:class I SAM-dependent methyltransferase [Risungbinella massiliensis]|uniref:class I SAM-dependent methyltransferase n=1 Tax=Risungbinella massiliensis TaxID=1329796 RepID=UPI00069AEC4F|nr:class I SAM-dependent methyltransferase [Risungbinella massiliensis]
MWRSYLVGYWFSKKAGEYKIDNFCSPWIYHRFVRLPWFTKKYIHDQLQQEFTFHDRMVLDFGSGTGANCSICSPKSYIGVDPDSKRIDYANLKYPDYPFQTLKDSRLPVEDQSIDTILIVAVLHHISASELEKYMVEFKRALKSTGSIVVIEPCFFENKSTSNFFMKWMDDGKYIRSEQEYLGLFENNGFECRVLNKFRKGLFYNELFFTAQYKN